ncbi:MAG TPA: twin-arginine translocase TatA/TatE family subunit [Gammaproteobacteria bacterium]|nr:twin-arginine translocase TatA/TatE family subunit [Gammaproteobacteria bacterium]
MGFGGISVSSLLIILLIVLVLFGGKRLRSLGDDLGGAIKGFRRAVKDDEAAKADSAATGETAAEAEHGKPASRD